MVPVEPFYLGVVPKLLLRSLYDLCKLRYAERRDRLPDDSQFRDLAVREHARRHRLRAADVADAVDAAPGPEPEARPPNPAARQAERDRRALADLRDRRDEANRRGYPRVADEITGNLDLLERAAKRGAVLRMARAILDSGGAPAPAIRAGNPELSRIVANAAADKALASLRQARADFARHRTVAVTDSTPAPARMLRCAMASGFAASPARRRWWWADGDHDPR